MLRLWVRVASVLATVAVATAPAGTAERLHRTHTELTGRIGSVHA
jgi:hypothetical protein